MKFTVRAFQAFSVLALSCGFASAGVAAVPSPVPSSAPIIHPNLDRKFEPARKPVAHTSVKDQGNVGFCWSYSTVARIESDFLKRTGESVDLSEEFIGFYSLYEQILSAAPTYFTTMERQPGKTNIGADLLIYFFFHPGEGAPDLKLANTLVEKYGVVPESAFSYKIKVGFLQRGVEGRVRRFINHILREPTKNAEYRKVDRDGKLTAEPNPEKILIELAKIYTLESEFDLPPAAGAPCRSCELLKAIQGFDYAGNHFTPKSFAKDYLKFTATDYEEIIVTAKNQASALARLQFSIDAGNAAEIGLTLFNGFREAHLGDGVFSPETCGATEQCVSAGGHALLVVNRTIDPRTSKPNGFVVKNSWGTKTGRDANGEKSENAGYDIITPDYLAELFKAKVDSDTDREWYILLKKNP
jgi:aminopeptidase C